MNAQDFLNLQTFPSAKICVYLFGKELFSELKIYQYEKLNKLLKHILCLHIRSKNHTAICILYFVCTFPLDELVSIYKTYKDMTSEQKKEGSNMVCIVEKFYMNVLSFS